VVLVGLWSWLVYGVGWSLELVITRGVAQCVGLFVLAIRFWGVLGLVFCCRWCVIVACCGEVLCALFCDVFGVLVVILVFILGGLWCSGVLLEGWCSGTAGLCCFCLLCFWSYCAFGLWS
jgi:hypothetical protein